MTSHSLLGPHALIDGESCAILARLLVQPVDELERKGLLSPGFRKALIAIGEAGRQWRIEQVERLQHPASQTDGWLPTQEYARLIGVSEQAVRKKILKGQLAAVRQGRRWLVEPSSPAA